MSHLSYEGQSKVDYCIECSVKHSQTAKVLMREALQRAEADDPSSEAVQEKVRGVIEELTGMEDDTDTVENENVRALNAAARELRKDIYSSKAEIGGTNLDTLREFKEKIDALVDQAYKVREEEEVCVSCVAPAVCLGDKSCEAELERAATQGKEEFNRVVEELRSRPRGESAAEKRRKFLEELQSESQG